MKKIDTKLVKRSASEGSVERDLSIALLSVIIILQGIDLSTRLLLSRVGDSLGCSVCFGQRSWRNDSRSSIKGARKDKVQPKIGEGENVDTRCECTYIQSLGRSIFAQE